MSYKYLCGKWRQGGGSALQRNLREIVFLLSPFHGGTEIHLWCSPGSQGGCWNLWQPPIKLHQHRRSAKEFVVGQPAWAEQHEMRWAELPGGAVLEEREGRKSYTHPADLRENLCLLLQLESSWEFCDGSKSAAIKGFNGTSSKHRT